MGKGSLIKGIHHRIETDIKTSIVDINTDDFKIRD